MKGHVLQGSLGCPLRKFEGVDGAGYMEDLPVPMPELPRPGAPGCCGGAPEDVLKPLTWAEAWKHLNESIAKWRAAGNPLTPPEAYAKRLVICMACPKGQYRWFQCRHCKCLVHTKAKLATETCPYGLWLWLSCLWLPIGVEGAQASSAALPQTASQYWDLAIAVATPSIVFGIYRLVPKIPKWILPASTPFIGILLGLAVQVLTPLNLTWMDMAKAGALAVFIREVFNQAVTQRMLNAPPPTPPSA